MKRKNKKSEFGRGFIYCLTMFAIHFENSQAKNIRNRHFLMTKENRTEYLTDSPPINKDYGFNEDVKWWYEKIVPIYGSWEKALSSDIETWANGASDHLYEIETPKKWRGTEIERKVLELQDFGLEIGHGFTGKTYTIDDFNKLKKLVSEITKLVDEKLGVEQIDAIYGEL